MHTDTTTGKFSIDSFGTVTFNSAVGTKGDINILKLTVYYPGNFDTNFSTDS